MSGKRVYNSTTHKKVLISLVLVLCFLTFTKIAKSQMPAEHLFSETVGLHFYKIAHEISKPLTQTSSDELSITIQQESDSGSAPAGWRPCWNLQAPGRKPKGNAKKTGAGRKRSWLKRFGKFISCCPVRQKQLQLAPQLVVVATGLIQKLLACWQKNWCQKSRPCKSSEAWHKEVFKSKYWKLAI